MSRYASKVISTATKEVGYLEKASNANLDSKTGNAGKANYTKYARDLDAIKGFYNGKKNGYPWCDVFVDWCFVQSFGIDGARELLGQSEESYGAGCGWSMSYFKKMGRVKTTPAVGDQIFFKDASGDICHTGLVYKVDKNYVYTIEGKTFFAMGGGYSIDKASRLDYQKACGQPVWFAEEMPSDAEYRRAIETLKSRNMTVDYILTHTAPRGIIQQVIFRPPDPHEGELNRFLDWIYYSVTFKRWYFGHLHEDRNLYDLMIACFEVVHRLEE